MAAEESIPPDPLAVYKRIIDDLVRDSDSLHARLVAEDAMFSKTPDSEQENALVRSLTHDQRQVLARMLTNERTGAFHDLLAQLTWWITCQDVALICRGKPMPVELSGMGLHGDYMGRLQGWEWPEE